MRWLFYLIMILSLFQYEVIAGTRIVGGKDAKITDWPWMVALVSKGNLSLVDRHFCGGTLIHPLWVLTAGHCIHGETTDSIEVITGISNLRAETGIEQIEVEQLVLHPDYESENDFIPPTADIALLKLARPSTQPIVEIADYYDSLTEEGKSSTVLGWGRLQEKGKYSDHLQQATVPVVSRETCNSPLSFDGDVQMDKLCAGYAQGGVDACEGDSGGPLVVLEGDRWKQIGVVSFGEGCARPRLYGVYTDVTFFQEFIMQHICTSEEVPPAPYLQVSVVGQRATAWWDSLETIQNYQLYYAPYSSPLNELTLNNIRSFSTGLITNYVADLPKNSEYYVAVRAYRGNCYSPFSNLGTLLIH